MFWEAVAGGLAVLGHYQVWLGGFGVIAIIVASGLITARLTNRSGDASAPGCLTWMVVGTVVQGLAITAFLTLIMPIILGGDRATPLGFIADHFGVVVMAAILGVLAMFLA